MNNFENNKQQILDAAKVDVAIFNRFMEFKKAISEMAFCELSVDSAAEYYKNAKFYEERKAMGERHLEVVRRLEREFLS